MVDAEVIEAERPDDDGGSAPRRSPDPEECQNEFLISRKRIQRKSLGKGILGEMVVGHKNAESYKTPFIFIYLLIWRTYNVLTQKISIKIWIGHFQRL